MGVGGHLEERKRGNIIVKIYNPDQELAVNQVVQLNRLLSCRLARMPIQYIVGNWDFR